MGIEQDIEAMERAVELLRGGAEDMPGVLALAHDDLLDLDRITRILSALKERNLDALQASSEALQNWNAYKDAEAKLARAVELLDDASDAVHFLAHECAHYEAAELGHSIAAFLQENGK